MTVDLTYLDDLARVQIAISALTYDGSVAIERSLNQLYWETVRGGVAVPLLSGAATLFDYEFPSDKQNFYRVVPIDPPAGLQLSGAVGDNASTPDTAVLDVANELRFGIDLKLADYDPGANAYLLTKYNFTANQRSYALRIGAAGNLQLLISSNGTGFSTAAEAPFPAENGERVAVRGTVSVDPVSGDYTALLEAAATRDSAWTQVATGSGTLSGTSLFNGTAPLVVGAAGDGSAPAGAGTVFSAWVEDSGTPVADPDFAVQATGTPSFADAAGRTWTMNGTAATVGPLLDSGDITPSLGGKIWLKSVTHSFLNQEIDVKTWGPIRRPYRGEVLPIDGRSAPIGTSDLRGSRGFTLTIVTPDIFDSSIDPLIHARNLDWILASGDTFFIHVPPGRAVPGGYVQITGDTEEDRIVRAGDGPPRTFVLPCVVVEQPAADIVAGTMTYRALLNLYGGYNGALAANPTYAALLLLMASLDDLVVP